MRWTVQSHNGYFAMRVMTDGYVGGWTGRVYEGQKLVTLWTPDSCCAHDFGSEREAARWMRRLRLKSARIVQLTDEGYWQLESG